MNFINGYDMKEEEYSSLLDKLYGFEEYYYYKQDKHYKDYLFVLNELYKIKCNVPMDESYKNAIIGWYIFFKNSKRFLNGSCVCFRITDACQLRCKHCYQQNEVKKKKHMTYDEFVYLFYKHKEVVKHFIHYNNDELKCVDLEGGETTLNPDLYKIIRFLNNNNIEVRLLTNGINIPDELITVLKSNKHNRVQVSIDGLEETHNFIRGEGTFQKSIANIKKLLQSEIITHANITLHELNYPEYKDLKEYLYTQVHKCELGKMLYSPQNDNLHYLSKDNVIEYFKDNPLYKSGNCHDSGVCAFGNSTVVKENGDFLFCGTGYDDGVTNYFTDDIETIIRKIKMFNIRWHSVPRYCFDCKNVSSCLGGVMCNNSWTKQYIKFNSEDRNCHLLNKKELGNIYEIQF